MHSLLTSRTDLISDLTRYPRMSKRISACKLSRLIPDATGRCMLSNSWKKGGEALPVNDGNSDSFNLELVFSTMKSIGNDFSSHLDIGSSPAAKIKI